MKLVRRAIFSTVLLYLSNGLATASADPQEQFNLVFSKGSVWSLSHEAKTRFDSQLAWERDVLLKEVPTLVFPQNFKDFGTAIHYFDAGQPSYPNRSVSCTFWTAIARRLVSPATVQALQALTKHGRVCIPADVAPEEREAWSLAAAQFFWKQPWAWVWGQFHSLESLIALQMGYSLPLEVTLHAIPQSSPVKTDAYGFGLSLMDISFVNTNRSLRWLFGILNTLPTGSVELHPEIRARLSVEPYDDSVAGRFVREPSIYLTASWAPEAMIEMLAHEFGHVRRGTHVSHFSGDEREIEIRNDLVHDEASAEAFAWMNLRALYSDYPEVEIFHVLKLRAMSELRDTDNHFVGAAAFAQPFHTLRTGSSADLKGLIEAQDLAEFIRLKGYKTLQMMGEKPLLRLPVRNL